MGNDGTAVQCCIMKGNRKRLQDQNSFFDLVLNKQSREPVNMPTVSESTSQHLSMTFCRSLDESLLWKCFNTLCWKWHCIKSRPIQSIVYSNLTLWLMIHSCHSFSAFENTLNLMRRSFFLINLQHGSMLCSCRTTALYSGTVIHLLSEQKKTVATGWCCH